MYLKHKVVLSLIVVLSCLIAKAESPQISKDSLINIAAEVSQWFGPDFDVRKNAGAEVCGPFRFATSDGRPEVQEHDGQTYFEVRFVPNDTAKYSMPYLSRVFLWNNGEPFEVLFSNGFGRDFFVDTYADLKRQNISVPYPFTDLYFHMPVEVASDLFQKVKPNDVDCIMHGRQKALAMLENLYVNSCGITDRDIVEELLTAPHEKIDVRQLPEFRKVRSIQFRDGIFIYPYFSCRFTQKDGKWYFQKTTGSQRKSGYLYENSPESMVFLGGWSVNEDPQTTYDSKNGVAGALYQLSGNRLIMLFIDPERDNSFEIYQFRK